MRIKKGDTIQMLTGKDRGKRGRVLDARPRDGKVVVENLNEMPRPIRDGSRMGGTQMIPGGIVARAAAVDVSNVMLVCPVCKRPTRVAVRHKEVKGENVRIRYCKRADCGQEIDR